MTDEESKAQAVKNERRRRVVALARAYNELLDCCKDCPRSGLCTVEKCSIYYAMKYRPLGRVMVEMETLAEMIFQNFKGLRGRPRKSLDFDEIKL